MTKDQKLKVWMDYVVTQIAFKYDLSIDSGEIKNDGWKYYPILNVSTCKIVDFKNAGIHTNTILYKSFQDFSKDLGDERISSWYGGWYWRFKDRIKL